MRLEIINEFFFFFFVHVLSKRIDDSCSCSENLNFASPSLVSNLCNF